MSQLIWRLHRQQVTFAAVALVVVVVLLLVTGVTMANDLHRALATCAADHVCRSLHTMFNGDGAIFDLVDGTAAVPLLFGLFWGAPLISKDVEDGTHNFAWTQSVTRGRWFVSNIATVLLASVAWATALSALVTWWEHTPSALNGANSFSAFDLIGIAPIGYSVFAAALGIAVGAILRRVLPTLAVTLGVFVAVRGSVDTWLRPRYEAPLRLLTTSSGNTPPALHNAWILSLRSAPGSVAKVTCHHVPDFLNSCVAHPKLLLVTYQPASRYWDFQTIEVALYVVAAALLLAFTYWRVTRIED